MARSRMFRNSLLVFLSVTALTVGGLAALAGGELSATLWRAARNQSIDVARTLGGVVRPALERQDRQQLQTMLADAFATAESHYEVVVLDPDGQTLASWPSDPPLSNHLHRSEIQQALRVPGTGSDRRVSSLTQRPTLYSAVAIRRNQQLLGFVRVGMSTAPVSTQVRRAALMIVTVAALGWVLSAVIAWMSIARLLRPLRQITADAKALAAGQDSQVVLANRADEMGELVNAIGDLRAKRLHGALELQEKSELLVAVLENMVEGVIAVAANETVLVANGASGRMLGFAASTAVGRALPEVIRSRPLHACVRQTLTTLRVGRDEFEAPGEARRILSVRAAPLAGSRGSGAVVVLHDVTDLRRLENLRKEFVANVSHELKTPLASIKAYSETLRLGAIHDAEHRLSFVERIEEQAERLHQLIVDLLHLARIEAGQQAFEFDEVPLAEVAQTCVEQFADAAAAKNIQLTICADSPPLVLHVDDEGLRTILNNLIDNGLKYTPPGGRVEVSWRVDGGYGLVSVADTGIGIALRDQTRIFERFFRVDKARSRELGGTGLGLSIVKHLCQAFGGDVIVDSQEGSGSTFRARLPLAAVPAKHADGSAR